MPAGLRRRSSSWWDPRLRPLRWLVVDAGAITHVDYTAARVVRELQEDLAQRGVELVFAHVQSDLKPDLDRHHLTEVDRRESDF